MNIWAVRPVPMGEMLPLLPFESNPGVLRRSGLDLRLEAEEEKEAKLEVLDRSGLARESQPPNRGESRRLWKLSLETWKGW